MKKRLRAMVRAASLPGVFRPVPLWSLPWNVSRRDAGEKVKRGSQDEGILGGGNSNIFFFDIYLGKIPHFDSYFFKWVETTN